VDPTHLRDEPARTRLIKFHGCAIHCIDNPVAYRRFLIATRPQITDWPHNPDLAALRTELTALASNSRTLTIGLSLQDTNLQDLFAGARSEAPWPWPSAPNAQGHVFCEDALGAHQVNMLRVVYRTAYGANQNAIEESALLRAYGKPALLALVLHLLSEKLALLARNACSAGPLATNVGELSAALRHLRNRIAAVADDDRLAFVNALVQFWSRGMALFRRGDLPPPDNDKYEPITPLPLQEIAADPNIQNSGLPELAVALALLGQGESEGKWRLLLPGALDIQRGVLQAIGTWGGAKAAQVYFASNAAAAIELVKRGATASDNVVIIHSDDAWQQMIEDGATSHRSPRGGAGRTGLSPVRHVSVRQLLKAAPNLAMLKQRFEEEITL
jgi:SIR2-like domain